MIYIKGEANTLVHHRDIMLKDIAQVECTDPKILSQVNVMKLCKIPEGKQHRVVISILKVIACIHEKFPDQEIENLGPPDLIITYEREKGRQKLYERVKMGFISVLVFFGAAFSIIAFHNDVSITRLFEQMYQLLGWRGAEGLFWLKVSYSAGITAGIIIFFNHFGKKRFSNDPSPMEVEMRVYEQDLQTTVVEKYSREGEEIDVES